MQKKIKTIIIIIAIILFLEGCCSNRKVSDADPEAVKGKGQVIMI